MARERVRWRPVYERHFAVHKNSTDPGRLCEEARGPTGQIASLMNLSRPDLTGIEENEVGMISPRRCARGPAKSERVEQDRRSGPGQPVRAARTFRPRKTVGQGSLSCRALRTSGRDEHQRRTRPAARARCSHARSLRPHLPARSSSSGGSWPEHGLVVRPPERDRRGHRSASTVRAPAAISLTSRPVEPLVRLAEYVSPIRKLRQVRDAQQRPRLQATVRSLEQLRLERRDFRSCGHSLRTSGRREHLGRHPGSW